MENKINSLGRCVLSDRQRASGLLCRSMNCDRCREFRMNRDQAIIDMHLEEMKKTEPQGLEKTAPETYLKLKHEIKNLQAENTKLQAKLDLAAGALEFYSDIDRCAVINDIDGRLYLNDKHNGEAARQALAEIKELKK